VIKKPSIQLPVGRPVIKMGVKTVGKAEVCPPTVGKAEKVEDPAIVAAREAVQHFECQYQILKDMRAEWDQNFSEANQAWQDVMRQEDTVQDAIQRAKPLVAASKMSINDFIAQRKWSEGHYDDGDLTRLIAAADDGNEVLMQFLLNGVVKGISLDKQRATAWFAQHPEYATRFQDAWKERTEMTTAVTVPKV